MEKWVDELFALIFSLLPFGKEGLKDFLFGHGLGPVWTVARDYVFNYRVWLLGVAPCVLLERWRPAVRGNQARQASLRLDLLYPVGKFLLLPVTAAWVGVITTFYHRTFPFLDAGLLDGQPLAVQMIGAFLIGDLAFYVSHRLRHSVKWFWYFHVIHHSQENLNPMTTYRTHFFDGVIETLIRTFPMALVGGRPVAWTLFIVLNNFWSYFLHANGIRSGNGVVGPERKVRETGRWCYAAA